MGSVRVLTEHEEDRAWRFAVSIVDDAGRAARCELRLAWADYEHWSGGSARPADVAEAVVAAALERLGGRRAPDRFDAAAMRRRLPGFDEDVRRHLGRAARDEPGR